MSTIRKGQKEDLPRVLELIKELAAYENEPEAVINTVEQMEIDGFGDNPVFGLYVADDDNGYIVGIAIYYYRYSTWRGKRIYLEDIVVTDSQRGKGIGKMLFDAVIEQGKASDCSGMVWQVLNWNEPAINFYEKYYHAHLDDEWINCSIELS